MNRGCPFSLSFSLSPMADVFRLSSSLLTSFSTSLSFLQPGLAPTQKLDKRIYSVANWDVARLAFRPRKRLPSFKVNYFSLFMLFWVKFWGPIWLNCLIMQYCAAIGYFVGCFWLNIGWLSRGFFLLSTCC